MCDNMGQVLFPGDAKGKSKSQSFVWGDVSDLKGMFLATPARPTSAKDVEQEDADKHDDDQKQKKPDH
jgi:hypothetical protein